MILLKREVSFPKIFKSPSQQSLQPLVLAKPTTVKGPLLVVASPLASHYGRGGTRSVTERGYSVNKINRAKTLFSLFHINIYIF